LQEKSADLLLNPKRKIIMQTNVAQLLKAPIGSIRTLTVDNTLEDNGSQYLVQGELTLVRTNRSILVQGTLTSQTQITCSRCLKLFTCKISINIAEEFFPTIDIITGAKLPEPEEPGSFTIDEHHDLDFTEAIRQYIVTAMPMKPLCKEECAGLCPTCGKDLNLEECGCHQEEIDPRWSELLKLNNSNKVKITNRNKGRK
jgi:uncharacterized protein